MRSSTESRSAYTVLDSLESGMNAVLFYDSDQILERFLFHYVQSGLRKGEPVHYWAGIRTIDDVEKKMSDYGIDCDYYERKDLLHFVTYDEMLLADGRLDPLNCQRNLFNMMKAYHNKNGIRLATESNWWLLADVFETGLDMEATHEMLPNSMSVVCTYNINDLMKYVNIYHLAKLMELHNNTLLANNSSLMLHHEFYTCLGNCILDALEESFSYITIARKKHSRFISDVLLELEMRIDSDMLELERRVEEKLAQALRLAGPARA